jgi:hypothetical protein
VKSDQTVSATEQQQSVLSASVQCVDSVWLVYVVGANRYKRARIIGN